MRPGPLLGAHVPVSGGLAKAPPRAREIGAEAIQIFTRNQLQWQARPVGPEEAAGFREALGRHPLRTVVAHGSYLVNLASPDPAALLRSREAFLADMQRCHALGVSHLIFHAGAHLVPARTRVSRPSPRASTGSSSVARASPFAR